MDWRGPREGHQSVRRAEGRQLMHSSAIAAHHKALCAMTGRDLEGPRFSRFSGGASTAHLVDFHNAPKSIHVFATERRFA